MKPLDDQSRFLETEVLPKRPPQLSGTVSPAPPVFLNRTAPFFFLVSWKLGTLESGNCEHFTGTACMHVSRTRKALATLQGPRQRLGQNARLCSALRGRLGIASEHARILAAPADARRIESRAALRRRRHLLSCDGCVMAVSADMLHRHFRTIGFALD